MRAPILVRDHFTLHGDMEADTFLPWIERYAAKLDVSLRIHSASAHCIEFDIEGPMELIDMMDIGCSLGPIDVWVEAIERTPLEQRTDDVKRHSA